MAFRYSLNLPEEFLHGNFNQLVELQRRKVAKLDDRVNFGAVFGKQLLGFPPPDSGRPAILDPGSFGQFADV